MIKFDVLNRYTGEINFTAEIDCANNAPQSVKLGLAVKWAIKNYANLSYANLSYADLSYANLSYASLSYASLSYANLSDASLSYANLSGANLKIYQSDLWMCCIQKEHIRIGCQYHTTTDWFNFTDEEISKMHTDALSWWSRNKEIIKAIHATLIEEE